MAEAGAAEALAALAVGDATPHDHMSLSEKTFRNELRARGRQAGDRMGVPKDTQQTNHLAHEAAYEHWHRMLFARFLAENKLLIAREYGVAVSLEDCRVLAREEGRDPWQVAGEWAQTMLPGIFGRDDPVRDLSLPPETGQKLVELLESLPAEIFTAQDSLGWTYQYWRADEKESVNTSGVKIGADELPAVTQLFTERYMVLFLLHNTVGAWRAGKVLSGDPVLASSAPDEAALRERMRLATGHPYDFTYLRFVRTVAKGDEDDERSGPWRPAAGTFPDWPRAARDLRILDPCCGSGHFLVEAFELLVRLRMEEERLARAEAVRAALRDNIFGLEIDPRCTQIAAFNLALAAWRMVGEPIELPALNVACCGIAPEGSEAAWVRVADELEGLTDLAEDPDLFGTDASLARGPLQEGMARLHRLFQRARDFGSLIDPEAVGGDLFRAGYEDLKKLLGAAVAHERRTGSRNEQVVAAAGMARAARMERSDRSTAAPGREHRGLHGQPGRVPAMGAGALVRTARRTRPSPGGRTPASSRAARAQRRAGRRNRRIAEPAGVRRQRANGHGAPLRGTLAVRRLGSRARGRTRTSELPAPDGKRMGVVQDAARGDEHGRRGRAGSHAMVRNAPHLRLRPDRERATPGPTEPKPRGGQPMTGTTYDINPWTPPYRVCDACEDAEPVASDSFGNCILGSGKRGEIATCDRPDHFTRKQVGSNRSE